MTRRAPVLPHPLPSPTLNRSAQHGALTLRLPGRAGKFGGIFASLPQAMVSGLFCVMFGLIAAVGISQLQVCVPSAPWSSAS